MRISDWSSDVCSSDLLDDVAQIVGAPLRRALARHREEGLHDPRAAVGGVADLGGTLDDAWIAGSLLHELGVADHHRERVVQLVRHPGQQRAEGAQLLALIKRVALARHLLLCGALLSQVMGGGDDHLLALRSEEHTSELPSLMRTSYAV